MPQQKRCKGCQQVKDASEFYVNTNGSLRFLCKPCFLSYNAERSSGMRDYRSEEYRKFNRDRIRRYLNGPGRERAYARTRQYAKAHPERVRAWKAVHRAVKAGRLIRPERCDCGRTLRITAHHDDYTRPLDVLWLCMACHKARHEWLKSERKIA